MAPAVTALLRSYFFIQFFCVISATYEDAYELETLLFTNYSTRIRPVQNVSHPVVVNCSFRVMTIVGVNEVQSQMSIIGMLTLEWFDEKLLWDPSDHGGIAYLHPYPKDVWRPRLQLMNSLQGLDVYEDSYTSLVLRHTGQVTWMPSRILSLLCFLNLRQFPFDKHTCELYFQPMYATQSNIILSTITRQGVDRERYTDNGEWTLQDASVRIGQAGSPAASFVLIVSLQIARLPQFFLVNFFIPVLLLSVLNLLSFTMVVGDGSVNIGYSMTVLLAYTIYMSILIDHLPSVSMNMPFLTIYLFILFTMALFTTVDIIFIVWLNNKEEEEEKKQKKESKLKNAINKLWSLKRFETKHTSPSEKHHNPLTQKRFPSLVKIHPEKDFNDRGKDDILHVSEISAKPFPDDQLTSGEQLHANSDDDYIRNRPHRVNKYKNMSEKVRIYSFYTFTFLNLGAFCLSCVALHG